MVVPGLLLTIVLVLLSQGVQAGVRTALYRRPALILSSRAPLPSNEELDLLDPGQGRIWLKRGDVHAERPEDVVAVTRAQLEPAMTAFAERGVPWVALQQHVPGTIVKFYGVADGRFFRWYASDAGAAGPRPAIDEDRLKALAFDAAALLGLEIFGGDVALPRPNRPILIDIQATARELVV